MEVVVKVPRPEVAIDSPEPHQTSATATLRSYEDGETLNVKLHLDEFTVFLQRPRTTLPRSGVSRTPPWSSPLMTSWRLSPAKMLL